jgi:hypothetical protein
LCVATVVYAQLPPPTPTVGFTTTAGSTIENAGTFSITVSMTPSSANTVTVQYAVTGGTATSPTDFTISGGNSGTLVFSPGTTSQTIVVNLANDPVADGSETIQIDLSNPTNASLTDYTRFTLWIFDAPSPTVSFDYSSWTCGETEGTVRISVTMTGTPTAAVSVNYNTSDGTAKAGTNYLSASGTLTWQPSEAGMSKTFTISVIDDGKVDPTLTVNIALSNPVNASLGSTPNALLYITDCDGGCP